MFDADSLKRKIRKLNKAVWEERVPGPTLDDWLECFQSPSRSGIDERLQMLYLLSNFLYFGTLEIRHLLRVLFAEFCRAPLIQGVRSENGDTVDVDLIDDLYEKALSRTRFLGVGNPSESGAHLLYYFRQENLLPSNLFINHIELPGMAGAKPDDTTGVDRYIFLDDLCATGDQVSKFSELVVTKLRDAGSKARVCFHPIFATSRALDRISSTGRFDEVACVAEFDDTFRCFSPESRFYKSIHRQLHHACSGYAGDTYFRHPQTPVRNSGGVSRGDIFISAR
ncbi:hypothetical protein [Bradyrhizobium sp. 17]|uniref:phosphoribosyltransferase-like protein n=1 Tax=Bradyrhizobium sp. 17 TaxID=2782649 RepID=UPI001FF73FE7|nr:hypothetical protein [Bradyrhizobium sp. 17]MCK1519392.1 hypothetical protein [Bradyrhizobium sp. 17]